MAIYGGDSIPAAREGFLKRLSVVVALVPADTRFGPSVGDGRDHVRLEHLLDGPGPGMV